MLDLLLKGGMVVDGRGLDVGVGVGVGVNDESGAMRPI